MLSKIAGGFASDVWNADRKEECIQRACAAFFQSVDQVFSALLFETVQNQQIICGQAVQVCTVAYAQMIIKQFSSFFGKCVNVHGIASGKVRHNLLLCVIRALDVIQPISLAVKEVISYELGMNTEKALQHPVVDKRTRQQFLAERQSEVLYFARRQRQRRREVSQQSVDGILGKVAGR